MINYITILILSVVICIAFYMLLIFIFQKASIRRRLYKKYIPNELEKSEEAKSILKYTAIKRKSFINKLEDSLDKASIDMEVTKFLMIYTLVWLIIPLTIFIITGSIILYLILLAIIPLSIHFVIQYLKKKRTKLFSFQLVNIVEFMTSSLKSGYSLPQSLNMIVTEGSPPASLEFERVIQDINLGKSYEEAFDNMIERNNIEYLEILATAINISRESGGNLSHILEVVSNTMHEKERLKKQIKSLTAPGRLSGMILVLLPIGIFIMISVMNMEFIMPLFTTTIGRVMIGFGIISQIIGSLFIRKITNLDG